jgi:hypothetical protein
LYLALVGGGVLKLGLLGGWWMAARAMQPIAVISDTAEKIATGDLGHLREHVIVRPLLRPACCTPTMTFPKRSLFS